MAIRAATRMGTNAINALPRSVLGLKTCICPLENNERKPKPLKAKLECPDGKLFHPSSSVC
jgi:hypothetical protein